MERPSRAEPRPAGRPVPSGATEIIRFASSVEAGTRPIPKGASRAGAAPAVDIGAANTKATSADGATIEAANVSGSNLRMAHRSILVNEPVLDAVVVIAGILAAHGDECVSCGLHVARLIGAAGLERGF